MGCGASANPEVAMSKKLDKQMSQAKAEDSEVFKLLLLGTGESGKSTLFKQMITLYGDGYSEEERKAYIPLIHGNIMQALQTLAIESGNMTNFGHTECRVNDRELLEVFLGDDRLNSLLDVWSGGDVVQKFWNLPPVQATLSYRDSYQLHDSIDYFMERIDSIVASDYIPSMQDVLRARVRTTGIVETRFGVAGNSFCMLDVGGQRNERKKWIHCFDDVSAVIFVVAINEYNQVLYEDRHTNRMDEALNLFEEICNSRWFSRTNLILFLNKRDLFEKKIKKVPLSTMFADYQGDDSYDTSVEFIERLFLCRNQVPDRNIYAHVTCATDSENIDIVFQSVKNTVVTKSMESAGFL